ncbi:MAG: hypothetical protein EZS28_006409, partial [Streblomastix strix]
IMHGKWYEVLPTLFTTKAYAGAKLHSLLLVEEEKTIDIEKDKEIIKSKELNSKQILKQPTYYPDKQAQALKQGENLRVCYSSTVFKLREDIVEPIDASAVGIDNSKQTLALCGANGAIVQITSAEVRIIPTLRFSATLSGQIQNSPQGQQNINNLNKSSIQQNDQQEQQNDDQKQVQQKEEQSWEILSEFVGYDVQQGILWPAPLLLSEEQCKQKLLNIQQNKSTSSINSSINQNHKYDQPSKKDDTKQRVIFECGCISDNLIAVSYKCVVFVLVWNPSKPKFTTTKTSQQSSKSQRSITQLPAIIHPVATLCFPSPVKALAASTICTRSFLIVGCESPPAVFLYRLDTIRISQQSEASRNQLWTDSEKLLNNIKYQIVYPTVLQPNSSLVIQNGNKNDINKNQSENNYSIKLGKGNDCSIISSEADNNSEQELKPKRQLQSRYIEVLSGSHQYVEVQYSSNAAMTRIFDLFPYDKPEQIVFTTFNRQVRIYSQKELEASDLDPAYGLSRLKQSCAQYALQNGEESLISKRRYFRNEGAVLMIAGHNGQLATTIAPLAVILDFPPEQPNNDQLLNTAQFFFPSLVTTMRVYPQRVKMAEDEGIVYVFGDRISALTWNNIACKIFWTDLENAGMMHSLVPMRVADEQPSLIFNVDEDEKSLLFSDDNSLFGSLPSIIGENSHKTDIPHPTIAWIDYLEQKLTFGTINKRRMVTRDIKDVSSQPLAIAHIPNMHAIAILCREHSSYPYDNAVEEYQQEQNNKKDKISTLKQKEYNDRKQIEQGVVQYKGSGITGSLMGLGLDVTGIVGNESQMYMPFHDLYTNYLQESEKIKNRNAISEIRHQFKSPISKSTTNEQLNNEQNIKKEVESNLKLSIQYFHESVPDLDSKGDPFVDIAADWFIESHKNQFKDYRPKRLPPYKLNTSKINLGYSMKSNFAQAFPEHLSPQNIQKALKKNNLFFSSLKKQLVSTTKNDLLLLNNKLIQPPKLDREVEINEQLPLPSKNRQQPFDAIPPEQFSTLLSSDPKTDEQSKIKENTIEFNAEVFEQYVKTVTNPFMIILYDESEMRLRIGDLNLSHLNLDFGKSSNELQKQSPKQDEQNSEQQYGDIHKLDTEVISTQLYNFFSMICVTMPTQQGFNEIQKILRENINELEQASRELGYDTQQMDKAEKIYKEFDESEFRVDATQIRNLIKLQNQLNINDTYQGEQLIQDAQTGIQTNLWQASQSQQINQIDEKIDENELTKLQGHLRGKNNKDTTQTQYDVRNSMLMPQQTGTYYDRYARSFLCVVGRESIVGLSSDNSPIRSSLNSPFQSHLFVEIEEEPFYESMVTDIFIFEVDRHHILGNARFKARQLLEKQIDEYCLDKDGNVINQEELIHFTDEQIQKSLDESEFLNVSHFDSSTSVMTTIYDKLQLLNISLTLFKRIRILGGVQAIYGYPSTLVVLNGCHAFVFLLGPRLDDKEVSTISKIYNLKGNEKNKQQMNKHNQYIHTVNGDGQQQLNDETCTCTTPLYTDKGKLFPTLPQHASIRNVRNITDSKGNLKLKYRISLPKFRQFYVYNNYTSAVPTKPVESFAFHNPYTFNVRLVTQIIAPSPITQIQLQLVQYKSYLYPVQTAVQAFTGLNEYSTFRGITMDHKMINLVPQFMLPPHYLRASVVFSPNGFAFIDLYFGKSVQANNIMRFQLPQICVYNPKDVEIFENSMRLLKESLKIKNNKPKSTPENITNYYANTPPVILAYVKKQDTEMIELLNGSIMPLAFAQRRCRHCKRILKVRKDFSLTHDQNAYFKQQDNNPPSQQINFQEKMIQTQQNSVSNYLTDVIEPKVVATDIITSQLILPPLNGTDLASAAGIYLKHRYRDLVKTAAAYSQLSKLIAQAYAPSIIIDASPLGINQFGLVSDNEVLIYVLLPNPLFKRQNQLRVKKNDNSFQNDGYEYLPLCAVLNVRIPTPTHFSFILRSSAGVNSILTGSRNIFIRKLYRNLEVLQNRDLSEGTMIKNDSESNQDKNQEKLQSPSQRDIELANIIKEEQNDDNLYAEDLDDNYQQNPISGKTYHFKQFTLQPDGALQSFPEIPSFTVFSRTGKITKAIPSNQDRIPTRDIFLTLHVYAVLDGNFGDVWKNSQIEIFKDFSDVDQQLNKLVIVEQAIREFITTGRIARRPPIPLIDFIPPQYGFRTGKFLTGEQIFGLSPLPITPEATNWRFMSLINFIRTTDHFLKFAQNLSRTRLIFRELMRRFIKYFQSLNLNENIIDDVQDKDLENVLEKEVFTLLRIISKPVQNLSIFITEQEQQNPSVAHIHHAHHRNKSEGSIEKYNENRMEYKNNNQENDTRKNENEKESQDQINQEQNKKHYHEKDHKYKREKERNQKSKEKLDKNLEFGKEKKQFVSKGTDIEKELQNVEQKEPDHQIQSDSKQFKESKPPFKESKPPFKESNTDKDFIHIKDIKIEPLDIKHYSLSSFPERDEYGQLLLKVSHPLRRVELSPIEEFDGELQHSFDEKLDQNKVEQQWKELSEENQDLIVGKQNENENLLLNLASNKNIDNPIPQTKPQLQRVQYYKHFPKYNQTQKDVDWQENISSVLTKPIKQQINRQAKIQQDQLPSWQLITSPTGSQNIFDKQILESLNVPPDFTHSQQTSQSLFDSQNLDIIVDQQIDLNQEDQSPQLGATRIQQTSIQILPQQQLLLSDQFSADPITAFQTNRTKPGAIPLIIDLNDEEGGDITEDDQGEKDDTADEKENLIGQINQF